jgi:hypothetical protein
LNSSESSRNTSKKPLSAASRPRQSSGWLSH